MKSILLAILFTGSQVDFERLADAIGTHEHSAKFPYGCEHRINGILTGYSQPQARQICLSICHRVWLNHTGDYFVALNKVYAKDQNWHMDVEKIFLQTARVAGNKTKQVGN